MFYYGCIRFTKIIFKTILKLIYSFINKMNIINLIIYVIINIYIGVQNTEILFNFIKYFYLLEKLQCPKNPFYIPCYFF